MPDISKKLEKADKYLQKGKQDSALETFLEILEEDPKNDTVRQTVADLCMTLGHPEDAAQHFSTLFDHQAAINDVARAAVNYKKLAKLTPPTIDQTFKLAGLVEKSNRKDAIENYKAAAQGFLNANRKPDALAAYRRLNALEPSFDNWRTEGELAQETGELPTAAVAFLNAAQLKDQAGEDGFALYERAYQLDAGNPDVVLAQAKSLVAHQAPAEAINALQPFMTGEHGAKPEFRETYAQALVAAGKLIEAEPFIWELFQKDPKQADEVVRLIGALLDAGDEMKSLASARRLEDHETRHGRRREFINLMQEVAKKHRPNAPFLEFLVELFNSANREQDYCATLLQLFELYFANGNFIKAGDVLDRAAEVDPYSEGLASKLELLRPKLDANRFNSIANRLQSVGVAAAEGGAEAPKKEEKLDAGNETTVLEDLMLQAEIFLQYSMRSKAVERLERINKLFPREEEKNEKLRGLYHNAGMNPKYADAPPAAAPAAATPAPGAAAPTAQANENAVDNISRVTEITKNIYRQGTVKSVLFAAVNDIGRHWNASRCVAGLVAPTKPPTAAMEYCAPGMKQSDAAIIVRVITTLQQMLLKNSTVSIPDISRAPDLDGIRDLLIDLGVQSLLAVALMDGDQHAGVLILEQNAARAWSQTDVVVLRTIADQVVPAVNNAKLRSQMKNISLTDEKSGLTSRAYYLDIFLSELRRAVQQKTPITVMLMNFGKAGAMVKEAGEQAVEVMMQQAGQVVATQIRQNDIAFRYDMTSIAVIMADTNDKNAFFAADKLRKALADIKLPKSDASPNIAIGIAEAVVNDLDPVDLVTEVVNRAEGALDVARAGGINQTSSLTAASMETAAVA